MSKIDRDAVLRVGGKVLAAQLAGVIEPSNVTDTHLAAMADLSVRSSIALDEAILRAEQRVVDEAAAAKEAETAERAAAKDAVAAEKPHGKHA